MATLKTSKYEEDSQYYCKVYMTSKIPTDRNNLGYSKVTTFEAKFPRMILAQMNTHRQISKNTSSDRAIPSKRLRKKFTTFVPNKFPKNGRGMHPKAFLGPVRNFIARVIWKLALHCMKLFTYLLEKVGVHKEITNRLLDPFLWTIAIMSSSYMKNFFELRTHEDAQLQIRKISLIIKRSIETSEDNRIRHIHLPLITPQDIIQTVSYLNIKATENQIKGLMALVKYGSSNIAKYMKVSPKVWDILIKLNTAKTARGSYLNQMEPKTTKEQLDVYDKLVTSEPIHASPLESCALSYEMYKWLKGPLKWNNRPINELNGNFKLGIVQYRKCVEKVFEE